MPRYAAFLRGVSPMNAKTRRETTRTWETVAKVTGA